MHKVTKQHEIIHTTTMIPKTWVHGAWHTTHVVRSDVRYGLWQALWRATAESCMSEEPRNRCPGPLNILWHNITYNYTIYYSMITYMCMCVYIHIYIYMYISREREVWYGLWPYRAMQSAYSESKGHKSWVKRFRDSPVSGGKSVPREWEPARVRPLEFPLPSLRIGRRTHEGWRVGRLSCGYPLF